MRKKHKTIYQKKTIPYDYKNEIHPLFFTGGYLFSLREKRYKSCDEQEENDYGEYEGNVGTHPFCDLETLALICFLGELFPAPAVSARTENYEDQRAEREQHVAYDKVLEVHYYASFAKGLNEGEQAKSEYAGK